MTHRELLKLSNGLRAIFALKGTPSFGFAVAMAVKSMQDIIEELREQGGAAPEKFRVFEQARIALAQEYAMKDDEDRPVMDRGQFKIAQSKQATFHEAMGVLQKEHADGIAEMEKLRADFEKLLDEPAGYKVPLQVDLDGFPDMTAAQMSAILPLVRQP